MKRAGFVVVALLAVALLRDAGVVAAEEAQFVERDGVLYVFNVLPRGPWAGWAGSANNRYGSLIDEMAERFQVPATLIAAVIRAESNFDPRAISPKGARGLMQLMPATATGLGVRDIFDPRENVQAGVRFLRDLINQFAGDVRLALAAYNAGPELVTRLRDVPPYPETRTYVTRVLGLFRGPRQLAFDPAPLVQAPGRAPARPAALAGLRRAVRYTAADGTTIYTNVPVDALPLTTRDMFKRAKGARQSLALATGER